MLKNWYIYIGSAQNYNTCSSRGLVQWENVLLIPLITQEQQLSAYDKKLLI